MTLIAECLYRAIRLGKNRRDPIIIKPRGQEWMDEQRRTVINLSKTLAIGQGSRDGIRLKGRLIKASLRAHYIHCSEDPNNRSWSVWLEKGKNKTCFSRWAGNGEQSPPDRNLVGGNMRQQGECFWLFLNCGKGFVRVFAERSFCDYESTGFWEWK